MLCKNNNHSLSLLAFFFAFMALVSACANAGQLTVDELFNSNKLIGPLPFSGYAPPKSSAVAPGQLKGQLRVLSGDIAPAFEVLRDDYGHATDPDVEVQRLPDLVIDLVQDATDLIPVRRGPTRTSHPYWEYSIEPGAVWKLEVEGDFNQAALPFSLREKNANCTHNGVLSFIYRYDDDGVQVSDVVYQIASETCVYFKFNGWGRLEAKFTNTAKNYRDTVKAFHKEMAARLPIRPIEDLLKKYPSLKLSDFDQSLGVDGVHTSAYGYVLEGIHYVSACQTRLGPYPFCDVMLLPSYSLAKSVFAGLVLMHMEALHPGVKREQIIDYVPECKESGRWQDVSFEHALDMVTGVHNDLGYKVDESSRQKDDKFFFGVSHVQKIDYACRSLRKKIPAGQQWVYHTSDTYVLTTALNNYLKQNNGEAADIFADMFFNSHRLDLSPVTKATMRTFDKKAQPFGGYGLYFYRDDIARLGQFVNSRAATAVWLDQSLYLAAMQRNSGDRGYRVADTKFWYNNGFWAKDYGEWLGCDGEVWVPHMSGYGGNLVLMMPNSSIFYIFSDGGKNYARDAILASHKINSLCTKL